MKYINDKKENIYNILRVLIILHFCVVNNGQGCQGSAKVVASCPKSAYLWIMHAKIECTVSNNYHCLITENHRDDKPSIIECCMKPQNITRGHMPRYNLNKNELQEIECQEDYYMPTQFSSNRYRDHDVQHCKYMKSNCNMEGMKICNHGSTTTDRSCYCDYKELYVPELRLDPGEHCFPLKDNLCNLRNDCDRTYQELNMMYQCVNKCRNGYIRPENELICRPLSITTTVTDKATVEASVPDSKPTKVPSLTTTRRDDMIKPKIENEGSKHNLTAIVISVMVLVGACLILIIGVLCYLRRNKKDGDGPNICCPFGPVHHTNIKAGTYCSGNQNQILNQCDINIPLLVKNIKVSKEKYTELYGTEVELKVQIPDGGGPVFWLLNDDYLETSNSTKYRLVNASQPSLKIYDLHHADIGSYVCKVVYEPENENEEEDSVLSPTIEVELIEPVFSLEHSKSIEVNFGAQALIHCDISNCPEKCETYWEKINEKNEIKELPTSDIEQDKYNCDSTKDLSTLTIKDMERDDVACYRCCTRSYSSEYEFRFKSHRKRVYILNEPAVHMIITSIHVYIGDTVSIGCDILYCPKAFVVFWEKIEIDNDQMRDLIEINDQTKDKYEMFNLKRPNLTIKNAQISDEAYYCCGIKYTSSSGDLIIIRSEKARLHVNEEKKASVTHVNKQFIVDANDIENVTMGVGELKMITNKTKELTDSNQRSITSGTPDSNADDKLSDTSSNATGSKPTTSDSSRGTPPINGQTSGHIDINLKAKSQLKVVPPKEDLSFSEMERLAVLKGFVVKNVLADGNCMFHAISHHVGDQISTHPLTAEEKAEELRMKIVQYLEKNDTTPNGEKYSSFLEDQINYQNGDKWSQYLNSMKQQGTYGDELILRAISHHFSVQILVLSTESPKSFLKYDPVQLNEQTKTIHLGFMHENRHYVRLEKKGTFHQQQSSV